MCPSFLLYSEIDFEEIEMSMRQTIFNTNWIEPKEDLIIATDATPVQIGGIMLDEGAVLTTFAKPLAAEMQILTAETKRSGSPDTS